MRAAPAIDAPLADGRAERTMVVLLHGAAAGALLAWSAAWLPVIRPGLTWASPVIVVVAVLFAALALRLGLWQARRCLVPGVCRLIWTGQQWQLQPAPGASIQSLAFVAVQLDLGGWLLLRLAPAGAGLPVRWVVARRRAAGPAWHGLHVALRHHAGRHALAAAGGLSAVR